MLQNGVRSGEYFKARSDIVKQGAKLDLIIRQGVGGLRGGLRAHRRPMGLHAHFVPLVLAFRSARFGCLGNLFAGSMDEEGIDSVFAAPFAVTLKKCVTV